MQTQVPVKSGHFYLKNQKKVEVTAENGTSKSHTYTTAEKKASAVMYKQKERDKEGTRYNTT